MAYNDQLAYDIREAMIPLAEFVEKKMFGGVGFLVNGNMACGVNKDALIVRVGPQAYDRALEQPHTRPFDMTGRPMQGWVMVDPAGYQEPSRLTSWVKQGVEFAASLPPKG